MDKIIKLGCSCIPVIPIGRYGEYNVRRVVMDISNYLELFGEGHAELIVKNPGGEPYVQPVTRDENNIVWTINPSNTMATGDGVCVVRWYTMDGGLAKSEDIRLKIIKSADTGIVEDMPDAVQDWLDAVADDKNAYVAEGNRIVAEATEQADKAEREAKKAQEAEEGAQTALDELKRGIADGDFTSYIENPYDDTAIKKELNNKTEKKLLNYDGYRISMNGTTQTYSMLYDYCMNKPDFVVLVYNNKAYHVNTVSGEQIVFISSYTSNGYVQIDRISINSSNIITVTSGKSEMLANKVNAITESNQDSVDKYPSVKAVHDAVDVKLDKTEAQNTYAEKTEVSRQSEEIVRLQGRVQEVENRPSGGESYDDTEIRREIEKAKEDLQNVSDRVKNLEDEPSIPQSVVDDVERLKNDVNDLNDRIDRISENVAKITFDGTAKGYHRAMKQWFYQKGVNALTPQGLTAIVDEWYAITRSGWVGGTVFKQPDVSTSSDGVKIGDNEGMVCVQSTSVDANRDDYAGEPLFAVSTINWILDENGEVLVTAIKGINDDFEQNNPDKYVGVMQMTGYVKWFEDEQTYTHMYADSQLEGYIPLPEARKLDGTVRNFMVHGKYMSCTVNGKMTCCSGLIPTAFNSHNALIDLSKKNGSLYSAGTIVDWSFLVYMTMIKYASMTQDARIQGCVNYSWQYYAKASEGVTNRILLTTSEAANVVVGSSVVVGTYNGSADRGQATVRSMTPNGAIVTAVEQVTVDGTTYGAVYLDAEITTVANGNAVAGSTIISSWHWKNGTNDDVLGNDGSHLTPTTGRYPAMIQGIEYSVGGYDVFEDVILNILNGNYEVYVARLKSLHKTSVQAGMVRSELISAQHSADSWNYIRRLSYDGEIFFGTDTTGGNSSTFVRDAFYKNGVGTKTGTREWLAFGALGYGSGSGGLASLYGYGGLGVAYWSFLARLSPNGNRGELRA